MLTENEKRIIIAYAKNDMNAKKAAAELYCHPGTLRYHFEKIKKKTSLNPWCFYDLIKLVEEAKAK